MIQAEEKLGEADPRAYDPPAILRRIQRAALPIAGLGALACTVGALLDTTQFLRSYLIAFFFWLSISLGCLAILMLTHVASGGWAILIRRTLEAASRTLLTFSLFFVPILLGLPRLYVWARPDAARASEAIAQKAGYLNAPFFIARAAVYFVSWAIFVRVLSRLSLAQDQTGDPYLPRKMRAISAAGLVVYCCTMTLASIDWLMSLNPRWYSTIYGVYVIGGQAVSAMSFSILVALFLAERGPLARALSAGRVHDLGKMLLAFVMLWAYFAFSQLLVIWSGDLPEESPYYLVRTQGGWRWVSLALILFHFALPFLLLLSRDRKRSGPTLAAIAGLLLLMRWVDLFWLVAPAFHPDSAALSWLDVAAPVALGAVWVYLFVRELAARPLLPLREPLLEEALHDE